MIRHSVVFRLRHPEGSAAEQNFFAAVRELTTIPGVQDFQILRQISKKNGFGYGIEMVFENETAYEAYNNHPLHQQFVQERWIAEVTDFLEIDYAPL